MWLYLCYHKGEVVAFLVDSGMREVFFNTLLQHTENMFTPIYKISFPATGLFLLGLSENSCQDKHSTKTIWDLMIEIIACKFKVFGRNTINVTIFQTQEITMDLGK
jgi:hypothetical protein